MLTNKLEIVKVFLTFIIIGILSLLCQLLPKWMPYDYFTNPSVETDLLSWVNFVFTKFIFSIPILLACVGLMVYLYFKQKSVFLFSIIIIHTPIKSILEGFFLIQKTNNFYQPEIATFPWNNLSEYWPYSYDLSMSLSLFLLVIIILINFYLLRMDIKSLIFLRRTSIK